MSRAALPLLSPASRFALASALPSLTQLLLYGARYLAHACELRDLLHDVGLTQSEDQVLAVYLAYSAFALARGVSLL